MPRLAGAEALIAILINFKHQVLVADVSKNGRAVRENRRRGAKLILDIDDSDALAYKNNEDTWVLVKVPGDLIEQANSRIIKPGIITPR
jgi:hypothetical protein